jgi:hypothetical protein
MQLSTYVKNYLNMGCRNPRHCILFQIKIIIRDITFCGYYVDHIFINANEGNQGIWFLLSNHNLLWLTRINIGSWFSECNLIMTQLDDLWKRTSALDGRQPTFFYKWKTPQFCSGQHRKLIFAMQHCFNNL